ncbi:MAG: DoxX family protein [Cyclobacteriaceae bacterium]|nr:DoxX family protein [Cyclobacteriaceae bacterium]
MKKDKIIYWVSTVLFAGFMLLSAIPNIIVDQNSLDFIHGQLGYPEYFIRFIGIGKAIGSIAILIPGLGRVKDWAYAGLVFDLAAAVYSLLAIGSPVTDVLLFPVFFLVGGISYYYHLKQSKAIT